MWVSYKQNTYMFLLTYFLDTIDFFYPGHKHCSILSLRELHKLRVCIASAGGRFHNGLDSCASVPHMELKVDEVLSSILPSLPALAFKLDNTEPLLGNILSLDCTALEHTCNY